MKILIAGDWHSLTHEEPVYKAFKALGHEPIKFAWHSYFGIHGQAPIRGWVRRMSHKFQNKFLVGPLLSQLNRDLLKVASEVRPDIIFVYRGTHISPTTLSRIKEKSPQTALVGYNNDDPFANRQPWYLWRNFIASVPVYDIVLAYRPGNVEELKKAGAKEVRILPPWFDPDINRPVELSLQDRERFECDVVFIGHYEADNRVQCLTRLIRDGYRVRLFGPPWEWDSVIKKSKDLRTLGKAELVWGGDYNKALCGAKIALCFLSKLNRDVYTRRCFEIPASGALLLSEYSRELTDMFKPGVEADFFGTPGELSDKIRFYMDNRDRLDAVSSAGHARVKAAGHDVVSRMRQVSEWISERPSFSKGD